MDWYSLSVPLLCFNVVDKKKKEHTRVYTYKDTQSIYGNPKKTRILAFKEQFNAC